MGAAAAVVAGATLIAGYQSNQQAKKARKQAEADAAKQREALAALQAEPEPTIPSANDDSTRAARRKSIIAQMRRRGRQSTILTDQNPGGDTLGV